MRVLFAGSPSIAVPSLEAVINTEGIEISCALTNPDSSKGRHGKLFPTDVAQAAQDFPVIKTLKLDASVRERVGSLKPDLLISFAYGRIFGPKFLSLFPLGGINIHPSLLPKYRGPSPIQAAILSRDTVTGITIQTLAKEMDCGGILAVQQIQLTGKETAHSLGETAAKMAAQMLPDVLKKIASSNTAVTGTPQNHELASYCSLVKKEDGLINWNMSALEIEAKIRAYNPWPLCRTIHKGRELLLLKADICPHAGMNRAGKPGLVLGTCSGGQCGILIQTGDGVLAVTELQYQAKKALLWRDFLNGARDFPGSDPLG
ncbi:MAG: methionyl-tRNA formyltransferase [Treponema sp.]|nr:methionyl-tRNA formyltransferase [Treponema sp.]